MGVCFDCFVGCLLPCAVPYGVRLWLSFMVFPYGFPYAVGFFMVVPHGFPYGVPL